MNTVHRILADLPSLGINPNEWTSGLTSSVGPWITGGLGLGVVVLAVLLGWSKLKAVADWDEADEEAVEEDNAFEEYLDDSVESYERELAEEEFSSDESLSDSDYVNPKNDPDHPSQEVF